MFRKMMDTYKFMAGEAALDELRGLFENKEDGKVVWKGSRAQYARVDELISRLTNHQLDTLRSEFPGATFQR